MKTAWFSKNFSALPRLEDSMIDLKEIITMRTDYRTDFFQGSGIEERHETMRQDRGR